MNFTIGEHVRFQDETYEVVGIHADYLELKRAGSHQPISAPISQISKIFQEGRTPYDTAKKLNG